MTPRLAIRLLPLGLGLLACNNPMENGSTSVVASEVAVGHEHTCTISVNGRAYCWGWGELGQLGDGELATSRTPRLVLGQLGLGRIDAGSFHSCGLLEDGQAYCWGSRYSGELGDGQVSGEASEPQPVQGGLRFATIAVGDGHTCGLDAAGQAFCWGLGGMGQLGAGDFQDQLLPVAVGGGITFRQISAGFHVTCGVSVDGDAFCWGDNQWGMLGDGVIGGMSESPVLVTGGLVLRSVAVGSFVVCGVTTGGKAYCWGSGSFGRLGTGDGSEETRPAPQAVAGDLDFVSLSVGDTHTCGVTTSDEGYCWGLNTYGKLGAPIGPSSAVPVAVSGAHAFTRIGVGTFHTCGITQENDAFCWGHNVVGQLGVPGVSDRTTEPVLVIYPPTLEDQAATYPLR